MHRNRFVATTVLYAWFGNLIKLLPYILLGMIHTKSMAASMVLMPAVIGGAVLGIFLHHRVGQKSFSGVVYCLLALAGIFLCYRAIVTLWL